MNTQRNKQKDAQTPEKKKIPKRSDNVPKRIPKKVRCTDQPPPDPKKILPKKEKKSLAQTTSIDKTISTFFTKTSIKSPPALIGNFPKWKVARKNHRRRAHHLGRSKIFRFACNE